MPERIRRHRPKMGVDRPMLNQHVSGLGATVYSAVAAPDSEDVT